MGLSKTPCPTCGGPIHRGSPRCLACSHKTRLHDKYTSATEQGWTRTESKDACEISGLTDINVRTLEDLIRVCEIDLATWEVERWVANKWEVAAKFKDTDQLKHTPLFQIKVWLKKRVEIIAAVSEIEDLLACAKAKIIAWPYPRTKTPRHPMKLMLEPSIPDLHAGKLAWGQETGHTNYDVKLAEQVFENALATLLERTSHYPISQIVFPVGNDLLNTDNTIGTTTSGTPQDTDSRFQKTFSVVRVMMTRAIETLRQIAPVLVIMVPGNHDQLSVWHLGDSLDCYFHRYKDVVIDNTPTLRKYYHWGQVMLMYTHGDKGKRADYPLVMATEQPTMWSATTYREAHVGHIHRVEAQEYHGVRVRTTPALCPPDAWHSQMQFTGNHRSAEAFVWDCHEGLVGTAFYTVQE